MPVTVNKPGFWYDESMRLLDAMAGMAQAGRNAGIPADAMMIGDRQPLQPGRIRPKDFPQEKIAPQNDPNKGRLDADWILDIMRRLDSIGQTVDVTGKMRKK